MCYSWDRPCPSNLNLNKIWQYCDWENSFKLAINQINVFQYYSSNSSWKNTSLWKNILLKLSMTNKKRFLFKISFSIVICLPFNLPLGFRDLVNPTHLSNQMRFFVVVCEKECEFESVFKLGREWLRERERERHRESNIDREIYKERHSLRET